MNADAPTSDADLTLESQFATAPAKPIQPAPRGRAGGLARAATARRWLSDGTFMSKADDDALWLETFYEPFAKGGRARAASAERDEFGRFAPRWTSEADEVR